MSPAARTRRRPAISLKSSSESFPIARSNSSSLIARSASSFSRSSAARVRWPIITVRSSSVDTSGWTVRSAVRPINAAPAISTAMRMTTVTPWPRAMKVAAVAHPRAARTKNCQGLIEVSELIVQAIFEFRIVERGRRGRRRDRPARPPERRGADHDDAGRADEIREQPRHPAEALVDGRAEHLLAAVLRDERLDDLLAVLALVHQRRELLAHLVRRAARVLAAFGDRLVTAGRAGANDFVLHLLLERRAWIERRLRRRVVPHALLCLHPHPARQDEHE